MVKAFVFGKFLPFHKGHEAMIRFAAGRCDFLTVLACCSDTETVPGEVRKRWIEETFGNQPNFEVRFLDYRESDLPNTSVASHDVSKLWSEKFSRLLPGYQRVITSEPYGDYIASMMGIEHVPFDLARQHVQS